jgi:hypothetical protein
MDLRTARGMGCGKRPLSSFTTRHDLRERRKRIGGSTGQKR